MSIRNIDWHPTARVVKPRKPEPDTAADEREEFIRRHEYSLIDLLAEKHPERILQKAEKIRLQKAAA